MFTSRVHKLYTLLFTSLMIVLLTGCAPGGTLGPLAVVKYHQVGACNGYVQGSSAVSVGPNAAYVVFRIETLDDTQPMVDFHFDPSRLYINLSPRAFVDPGLMFAQDLGVLSTVPVTVPHGTSQGNNGFSIAVVSTSTANGSSEANKTAYNLLYNTQPGDPGVLTVKTNSGQTSWAQTDNCRAMILK